jgi:mxaJ protein
MSFRFLKFFAAVLLLMSSAAARELHVCADPANLPFSNRQQQGFENRLAELVAHELNAKLVYEWQRMGRGFVRDVLNKGRCDALIGIPSNFRPVLTTEPYHRSTYVFVSRRDRGLQLHSFDDPQLKHLKVGVQVLSEDYTPPAEALVRRGMVANIVGFDTTGDRASSIIDAVLRKQVDAAVVWGPLAGYFARRHASELEITQAPQFDPPSLPLAFSISMGVRKSDPKLREQLNQIVERRKADIERILRSYGVPMLSMREQARAAD